MSTTTTATTKKGATAPLIPEQRSAPLANVTEAISNKAAVNALPPVFPLIVAAPKWDGAPGAYATNALFFIAAGLLSAAYYAIALGVWTVLHALMWINAHFLRTAVAVLVVAVAINLVR